MNSTFPVRDLSILARIIFTVTVGPLGTACLGTTDLKTGGGGLELKEAEAPEPDDCVVVETVRRGLGGDTKFDHSTKSTAPNKRFASWRLKWPESSGKKARLSLDGSTCIFIATIINSLSCKCVEIHTLIANIKN